MTPTQFGAKIFSERRSIFVYLTFGILAFSTLMSAGIYWNPELFQNLAPGRQNDDVFFDNLAYNLSQGDGFKLDFTDERWKQAFQDPLTGETCHPIVNLEVEGVTTTRSPGYPFFLAMIYGVFGRRWDAVYVIQWITLCFGLTILLLSVSRKFGVVTGTLAAMTLAFDYGIMKTIGQVMSEAIATSLVCLTFCCLIWAWDGHSKSEPVDADSIRQASQSRPVWRWAMLGLMFGILIQLRANCLAWLMVIITLSIPWAAIMAIRKKNPMRFVIPCFIFMLTTIVVCLPWAYRNCSVVGKFQPLGMGADIGWVGGYSDAAFEQGGNWVLSDVIASQEQALETCPIKDQKLAVQEYYMGKLSREKGNRWAVENWHRLPRLMAFKALNHFALVNQTVTVVPLLNGLLLIGAMIGCLASWHRFGFWVALILFCSTVTTMLTWSHHGRYLIPLRPLIHCASAVGTIYCWKYLVAARPGKTSSFPKRRGGLRVEY